MYGEGILTGSLVFHDMALESSHPLYISQELHAPLKCHDAY